MTLRAFNPEDDDAEIKLPTVLAPLIEMRVRELGFGSVAEYFALLVERDFKNARPPATAAKMPEALREAMDRETLSKLVRHHGRAG